MKAVTFQGPLQVEVRDVPDPTIQQPQDVVLKVTSTAICGSDLHAYNGRIPIPVTGWVMGHEYVGEVAETGAAVGRFSPGDRVVGAPFAACGECFYCGRGLPSQCTFQQHFGFGMLAGAQAQYLRVPFADSTLEKVPDGLADGPAVLAGDILSTGYYAAERGEVRPGDVVVVVGSGPVGLCAQMCARLFEPTAVIAVDSLPERLALAEGLGSVPADLTTQDAAAVVREHTEGRGADVVLEAVGSGEALRSCFQYVRPGGVISAVGVYSEAEFAFPMFQAYLRGLTFRIGACPVQNYIGKVLGLIEQGRLEPGAVLSHTMSLEEAPRGYDMFAHRREGCVKVLLEV